MPIASGETYAAFLEEQEPQAAGKAPLIPVADPVIMCNQSKVFFPKPSQTEQPFSNFGYDVAGRL